MLVRTGLVALCMSVAMSIAAPAWCQPKTDVVTLRNGDHVTGDIKSLSRGRLSLETDDAGTIAIEWDKVLRVQSTRLFEIETSDGRRLLGSLSSPQDGQIVVGVAANPLTLVMDDVTRLTPIGASFWSKIEGQVNAGFSYTHSSGIAQITFSQNAVYRRPAFQFRVDSSATVTKQENVDDDDRAYISTSYIRYRGLKWFIAAGGQFESNESLGLVLRSQVGGTVGQRLVNTNRAQVQLGAGAVANNEQNVDAETTQSVEALLMGSLSYYTYDSPKTTADFKFQYYPSLTQKGRQRIQIDSSFQRELITDLTVTFTLFYTFDSKPPQEGAARTDIGIVTSIGWRFGG